MPVFKPLAVLPFLFTSCLYANSTLTSTIEQKVHQSVLKQVSEFTKTIPDARYEVKVRPISSRQSLEKCNKQIVISAVPGSRPPIGVVKRVVECPQQWRISVMTDSKVFVPVIHSSRPLSRGQTLTSHALQIIEVDYSRLRGQYFSSEKEIEGRIIKRSIGPQKLISASMLEKDFIIRKGDTVRIVAGGSGLQVSMSGVSLDDGEKQDSVRVRNKSSGKIVDAVAIGRGKVKIHH